MGGAEPDSLRDRGAQSVWEDLADFAVRLSAAATLEDVLHALTSHGLPILRADGCGLVTRAADGGWELALATSFGSELRARFAYEPLDSPLPACRAAREGRTFLVPDREAALAVHPRMAEVVDVSGRPRWALLPLQVAEETYGSLAVSWADPRPFGEDEVGLLAVFAAHCAPSLHRVVSRHREDQATARVVGLAQALQRGVLSQLPVVDGLDLGVSYQPVRAGASIGGDWYDVFPRASGDLLLAIGDVAGHDAHAAAAMTRLRTMLRGLAWDSDDGPARLLDRLDAVVAALEPGTLATAVLATATLAPTGRLDVRWANAGHPPPLARHADGRLEVLRDHGVDDLLLGVDASQSRTEHRVELEPGSLLALVTDGVVDERVADLEQSLVAVGRTLEDPRRTSAQAQCRRLAQELGPDPDDDRTILLVGVGAPAAGEPDRPEHPTTGGTTASSRVALLTCAAESVAAARHAVRQLASADGWDEDTVDTAELLVSELVTNAVTHGRSDIRLRASSSARRLLVEVADENDRVPELLPADPDALSGRGLQLVDLAADAWGCRLLASSGGPDEDADGGEDDGTDDGVDGWTVEDGGTGKVVWFALDRPAPS
ncbi:SpoIIE family protein phosphatase [Kineococcus sp. NPDC059986]|uniref:ATP-binding SpoIIE family protein phosphatase n=1 Tax=Kineococcus sp. NPDC059986 TaxID=3155538 RepID=UPI00344DB90B